MTEQDLEDDSIHLKFKEWLDVADTYPPTMRESARRFRHHKVLKEGAEPQTGVYYWVPLPGGKWDMMNFFDSVYGEVLHDQLWGREVVPYLTQLWKLNALQTTAIRDAYAGLPRGRISKVQQGYAHYHGGDAPINAAQLDSVVKREFGLPFVNSVADDHERMLQDDVNAIQSALGDLGLRGT